MKFYQYLFLHTNHLLVTLMPYLILLERLVVGLLCLTIYMRIYGKKFMSQVNPLDLINMMVIGGIIGGIIYNPDISLLTMICALLVWGVLNSLFIHLSKHFLFIRKLTQGQYIRLITKGRFDREGIIKAGMDLETLRIQLRMRDIFSLKYVEHAQLETNGHITVKRYNDEHFSTMIINDGNILHSALEEIGKDEDWLNIQIEKHGHKDAADIYYAEWIENEGLFIIERL